MKGQYKILVEIMLFAIGLSITSYVILSFGSVQKNVENITVIDNMNTVANSVVNGILKAVENVNSTVKITIPEEISGHNYKISALNNELKISSLQNPAIFVKRQIFNISQIYSINTDVASAAKFIEIRFDGKNVWLMRWRK